MQRAKKQRFKVDLVDMHAVCEANYARLMRLFPDYETSNQRELIVGAARVRFEVRERWNYTTVFQLYQSGGGGRWLGQLQVEVRAYHDAGMLEVGAFQSHRRIRASYQYPNDCMYQQDEKAQQNRFLADWLEHCLLNGRTPKDVLAALADS